MQPPPPRSRNYEGGYDSHAASYGNYDAPSPHCRRPGSDGEHGRYATESYMVDDNRSNVVILPRTGERLHRNSDPDEEIYQTHHPNTDQQPLYNNDDYRYNNSRQRRPPSRTPGGKYYSQNHDPMLRVSQASTIPAKGSGGYRSSPQPHDIEDNQSSWDEEQSSIMQSTAMTYDNSCLSEFSSYCPSVKTASTAGSSTTSGSSTILIEEDVIRQGVIDISMLIATYLAGALSFVIGILLTLCSPVIKMIKLIVGDVRGILGDAGFIHELGSLWRVLRTRSSGSSGSSTRSPSNRDAQSTASASPYNPRYDQYSRNANYYDDESTVGGGDDQSSVYTENSPQFIGGWRPRVNSSSVGSSQLGTGMGSAASNSSNHTGNSSSRRSSSRSYPSLSQVHEGQSSYYHQDDRRSSPQAQQQQQAPMSHGAPSMMYQGHQAQQHHPTTPSRSQQGPPSTNSSGYYSHGGYQPARARSFSASPVKQSQHRHCGPSSGISSHYSPQKNRRQRPGVV